MTCLVVVSFKECGGSYKAFVSNRFTVFLPGVCKESAKYAWFSETLTVLR